MHSRTFLPVLLGWLLAAIAPSASASPAFFNFYGTFSADDDSAKFAFLILTPGTVQLESWSYAGGTDPLFQTVAGGGFAPVLSLFDGSGNLLAFDSGGVVGGVPPTNCATGGRTVDAVSGFCLDAYTQVTLSSAGQYFVVVTEQGNTPNGPTLADGFALDGTGNFTGGPFIDPGGFPRTSFYDFTIGLVDSAQSTDAPEPSSALLLLPALAMLFGRRVHRRIQGFTHSGGWHE